MRCPRCRLISPDTAMRCDCGYDFVSGTVEGSYLTPRDQEFISRRRRDRTGRLIVFPSSEAAWLYVLAAAIHALVASVVSGVRRRRQALRPWATSITPESRDPALVACRIRALQEPESRIRERAADALFGVGECAVQPLIEALADPSGDVRRAAASSLRMQCAAFGPLHRALKDPEKLVRRRAAVAVAELASHCRGGAESALVSESPAVAVLLDAMDDTDRMERYWAAYALGCLADGRASDALIRALEDEDYHVRAAAASGLGRWRIHPDPGRVLNALRKRLPAERNRDARRCIGGAIAAIEPAVRRAPAELEAAAAPSGTGSELEAASLPTESGSDAEAAPGSAVGPEAGEGAGG